MKNIKTYKLFESLNIDSVIYNTYFYHEEFTQLLGNLKSQINVYNNKLGVTLFHAALITNSHINVIKKMIKLGANVDIKIQADFQLTIPYEHFSALGSTPLIICAKLKKPRRFFILLTKKGADWNITDTNNKGFIDYLTEELKSDLKYIFPEKYEKYYLFLKTREFNI